MDYIAHRINSISQLKKLNSDYGVEIDIRDDKKDLVVVHDPFKKGIKLKNTAKASDVYIKFLLGFLPRRLGVSINIQSLRLK